MPEIRFLDRLRKLDRSSSNKESSLDEVIVSIVDHLGKMLNTRRGSTVIDNDFGMPDFTGAGVGFSIDEMPQMENEIAAFIQRCDPRLNDVKVHYVPDATPSMQMSFTLDADIPWKDYGAIPIHLMTKLSTSGRVSVMR